MSRYFTSRAFITHWLDAVDDHSIHSPYFFEFYKIVKQELPIAGTDAIEQIRAKLLQNTYEIEVPDWSNPSARKSKKTLAQIAASSLAPSGMAKLYCRIAQFAKSETILELGTSLGVTSLYLSLTPGAHLITLEGNKQSADVALTNFESMNCKNIKLIMGNIDQTLKEELFNMRRVDFVLLDANHSYEPTMRYFDLISKRVKEKSIVVIDDIHRSKEMERAWAEIRKNELVYTSIDLFRCGILFFEPSLGKQHFVWELPIKMLYGKDSLFDLLKS